MTASGSGKSIEIFVGFYSVKFIQKLDIYYKKWYVTWLQIFSAAVLPNIIEIGQHLTK